MVMENQLLNHILISKRTYLKITQVHSKNWNLLNQDIDILLFINTLTEQDRFAKKLASLLYIEKSQLSRSLKRLKEAKLIENKQSKGKEQLLILTNSGQNLSNQISLEIKNEFNNIWSPKS